MQLISYLFTYIIYRDEQAEGISGVTFISACEYFIKDVDG
jgi:hypothetical protein